MGDFRANARNFGVRAALRTFFWNLRFNVGYLIGGFTSAKRDW